ncbi:MAG: hypothetical protein ACRD0O_10155 [Acidimicrobiia bacterium]
MTFTTPRRRRSILVGLVSSILVIAGAGPSGVATAEAPSSPDPDAAVGLDDLDWVPPVGSVMASGGAREMVPLSASRPSGKEGRTMGNAEVKDSVEPQYSYCIDERAEVKDNFDARGCWFVGKLGGGENDGFNDYYFHEFSVNGVARRGTTLHRVKGRNESTNGENVRWSPGSDANYGDPTDVSVGVSIGYGGVSGSVSRSFRMYPGRLHPYAAGRSVFHSSWIANNSGAKPGVTIESAGINVWKIPQGQQLKEDANWFIWFKH